MYDSQEKSESKSEAKQSSSKAGIQRKNKNQEFQKELQLKEAIQRKPNKTGLPDKLKSGIENLSGHSLDDVKVHYNSSKPAQLNAHAYAQGNQIHLGGGQEKHLAHEAWHVVQQKQGRVKPTVNVNGAAVNDNLGLEKEADVMGGKTLQLKATENRTKEVTDHQDSIQLKTEIFHNSGMQGYLDGNGEKKRQLVGKSMYAYLDPYDPLLGTESSAFTRTGIYTDSSFSYKDKKEHQSAKGPTAMHLLNAHLGGLAISENLFPQRAEMNLSHLNVAEYNAKAMLLTLRNGYTEDELDGARLRYGVEVFPASSVLTPENIANSKFYAIGPKYVDKNNNVVNDDWETIIDNKLNEKLGVAGWSVENSNDLKKGNKVDLNSPFYVGNRNHFQENIIHKDELGDVTRRTHHHDSRGFWPSNEEWDSEDSDFVTDTSSKMEVEE
jgi:hypothetical protein